MLLERDSIETYYLDKHNDEIQFKKLKYQLVGNLNLNHRLTDNFKNFNYQFVGNYKSFNHQPAGNLKNFNHQPAVNFKNFNLNHDPADNLQNFSRQLAYNQSRNCSIYPLEAQTLHLSCLKIYYQCLEIKK